MSDQHIKIFVSSPSDVASERECVSRVVHRLESEFEALRFEVIRWEDSWYSARAGFQEQIVAPDQCDLVIVIVWKRLGSPLPDEFARTDGSTRTGTEYEFEVAMESSLKQEVPDILVYRKTEKILFDSDRVDQEKAELQALEGFWRRWLRNEKGHFTGAFKSFETVDQFADHLERDLRVWLADRQSEVTWPEAKGSPFRGLEAFDAEHASVFFGRKRATRELRAKLLANANAEEACNFMVVVGASGSGKSSLVRAGLIPSLQREGHVFRYLILTPSQLGAEPLGGLARHLFDVLPQLKHSDCPTPAELADHIEVAPQRAARPIEGAIRRSDADKDQKLLVLIDQLEEVFQWPADIREKFLSVIEALAKSPQLFVLATIRSDFYPQLINCELLKSLSADGRQYNLAPIREYELKEVIQGPAESAGLEYERKSDMTLDQALLDEAQGESNVLPLLEFTLERLYQERDRQHQRMTFNAYDRLGGLTKAIGQHAEQTLEQTKLQQLFPDVIRKLVSVTEDGEPTRLSVPLETFGDDERRLIDALVEARLLVTSGSEKPVVIMAHDALLREWSRLSDWLADNKSFLRWQSRIAREMKAWEDDDRDPSRLIPPGRALEEAKQWQQQAAPLSSNIESYISSSLKVHKRATLLRGSANMVLVATCLVGVLLVNAWLILAAASNEYNGARSTFFSNDHRIDRVLAELENSPPYDVVDSNFPAEFIDLERFVYVGEDLRFRIVDAPTGDATIGPEVVGRLLDRNGALWLFASDEIQVVELIGDKVISSVIDMPSDDTGVAAVTGSEGKYRVASLQQETVWVLSEGSELYSVDAPIDAPSAHSRVSGHSRPLLTDSVQI